MDRPYPVDLSDAEYSLLEPHLPPSKAWGCPRLRPLRKILGGIFYVAPGRHLGWSVEVVRHPPKPQGIWAPEEPVINWTAIIPKGLRGGRPRRWVVGRTYSWFAQSAG